MQGGKDSLSHVSTRCRISHAPGRRWYAFESHLREACLTEQLYTCGSARRSRCNGVQHIHEK